MGKREDQDTNCALKPCIIFFFFFKPESFLVVSGHAQQQKIENGTLAVLSKGTGVLIKAEWLIMLASCT